MLTIQFRWFLTSATQQNGNTAGHGSCLHYLPWYISGYIWHVGGRLRAGVTAIGWSANIFYRQGLSAVIVMTRKCSKYNYSLHHQNKGDVELHKLGRCAVIIYYSSCFPVIFMNDREKHFATAEKAQNECLGMHMWLSPRFLSLCVLWCSHPWTRSRIAQEEECLPSIGAFLKLQHFPAQPWPLFWIISTN